MFSKSFQFFICNTAAELTMDFCEYPHYIPHDWAVHALLDVYYGHARVLDGGIRRHALHSCISTQTNNMVILYQLGIYINISINQQILEKEIRIEREGDRDCLV